MEQTSPTRMNLLIKKGQLQLARQGRDLLEQKRQALMQEFLKVVDVAMRQSEELDQLAAEANYSLSMAKAIDGPAAIRSAAFAARTDVQIEVSGSTVMGVPIPVIERKSVRREVMDRGYSLLATSSRVDEVSDRFEEELNLIVELATIELRLRRVGDEIRATARRVNALDNTLIPRLRQEMRYISTVLEEREREDIFRLKRVKKVLARGEDRGACLARRRPDQQEAMGRRTDRDRS